MDSPILNVARAIAFGPVGYMICEPCEVSWTTATGEACWRCGRQGIPYLEHLSAVTARVRALDEAGL